MNETSDSKTLRDYLGVLKTQHWLIFGITLVAVLIGIAYSLVREPTYESTATIEFQDPTSVDLPVVAPGSQPNVSFVPDKVAAAKSRLATRDDVVSRVFEAVPNSGMTEEELRDSVNATVQPDSNLVAITASADDAELAARIANEFATQTKVAQRADSRDEFATQASALRKSLTDDLDPTTTLAYRTAIGRLETLAKVADPVSVTEPAVVPGAPASPKPVRDTILAGVLGLIVGLGAGFLRNALDRRITDSHELQHELGLPIVGYVRADSLGLAGIGRNGDSFVSESDLEAFRILRRNVDFLAGDQELTSIVVTSALPEEGKSTVAAWYAYVSAVAGRRTLLVECDFRRPVLANRFGVEKIPGLADYLSEPLKPQEVLRSVPVHGREAIDVLPVIPAGGNVFQPTEMIASERFQSVIDQMTRAYDMVVFDSAPLLPVGDTLELIPSMDGVLFCVRLGQTTRDQARSAWQAIRHLPEKPTGLVVTGVKAGGEDDYYGYYSYVSEGSEVAAG